MRANGEGGGREGVRGFLTPQGSFDSHDQEDIKLVSHTPHASLPCTVAGVVRLCKCLLPLGAAHCHWGLDLRKIYPSIVLSLYAQE